jgi:hypothetical protein
VPRIFELHWILEETSIGTTIEIHPKFTENPKIMSRKKETRNLESRP